jgi:cation:H+ antiporter
VVWLVFLVAALAVVLAATMLARNADVIADRTGLGQVWIGVFLLAAATSLPELVTGVAAVRMGSIDLAGGNIFGSNMANMALLGLLGLVYARRRVIQREAPGIALTASVAIIMTGIASLFIVARLQVDLRWLSIGSLALVTVAVSSAFLMRRHRETTARPDATPMATVARMEEPSLAIAAGWFTAAALVVVAAGVFLVDSAEEIAEIMGVSDTFFGVLALALATSLPELSTSAAAVRMGAMDLAVSNLYGSNMANMTILAFLDVVYVEGPLLESINVSNAVAGVVAMLLMTVGLMEMILRTERRRLPFDPAAGMILAGYVLGLLLVWSMPAS